MVNNIKLSDIAYDIDGQPMFKMLRRVQELERSGKRFFILSWVSLILILPTILSKLLATQLGQAKLITLIRAGFMNLKLLFKNNFKFAKF